VTMENHERNHDSTNLTCHGSNLLPSTRREQILAASRPSSPFVYSKPISNGLNSTSVLREESQMTSHLHNGIESLKANESTLIKSSLLSTGLQIMKNGTLLFQRQRLFLEQLKQQGRLLPPPSGWQHGEELREQSPLFSRTEQENSKTTPSISRTSLQQRIYQDTVGSSNMTSQLGISSVEVNKHYSPIVSLYSAIVMPDGVQYASNNRRLQSRGKTELCNRFNNKGCHASTCRYKHACKTCGSSNHGKSSCNSPTKD
jgi:hypothetical protein